MAIKGFAHLDATSGRLLAAEIPTSVPTVDIVVAASGGDYTLPSAAFAAGGEDKTYYIEAGTYLETTDFYFPSNTYVFLEPKGDGVIIDFNNTANTIQRTLPSNNSYYATATISGATFTVNTTDLSDMEANPSLYSVAYKGKLYAVSSANDAANTITLTTTPIQVDAGADNIVAWGKDWQENITLVGKLTLRNSADSQYLPLQFVNNCDLSKLSYWADRQTTLTAVCNADLGTQNCFSPTLTDTYNKAFYLIASTSIAGKFVVNNVGFSSAGSTYGVNLLRNELLNIDVLIAMGANPGAGVFIGLEGNSNTKKSTVTGVVVNVDTTTSNVGNINTAALRTT